MAQLGRSSPRPDQERGKEEEDDEVTAFLTPFALESDQPRGAAPPSAWAQYRRWMVLGAVGTLVLVGAVVMAVTITASYPTTAGSAVLLPESAPDQTELPTAPPTSNQGTAEPQASPSSSSPAHSRTSSTSPHGNKARSPHAQTPDAPACDPRLVPSPGTDTVFFILGDWGRDGGPAQTEVARKMTQVADCMRPNFVISTGDNFYPSGLSSDHDPQVARSFTNVYNATSLQVPWYAVLGNHDYGDGVESEALKHCQLDEGDALLTRWLGECRSIGNGNGSSATSRRSCCFSPMWQVRDKASGTSLGSGGLDPRWNLKQGAWQFQASPDLAITLIDTSPFIREYHKKHWANLVGGISSRGTSPVRQHQTKLVDELLQNSSKALNIVVGHHPVQSLGNKCHGKDKEECEDIANWLNPLMQKHKVLAYVSSHEHDLQYMPASRDAPHLVISGAGSDANPGDSNVPHNRGKIFHHKGFVAAVVHERKLTLFYYTVRSERPVFNVTLTAAS